MGTPMKRILILGCDGYVGEHLIEHLVNNSAQLYGFDLKCEKQTSKDLEGFCSGDIKNHSEFEKCIIDVNPHIIIDLAANADVAEDARIDDYDMNYCTPGNIYDILTRNSELNLERIIFTSSQYVIGPIHSGEEKFGYAPHTIYGISKVILEQRIFELERRFFEIGVDFFIVRPTNVWGGRHPKYSGAWEKLLKQHLVVVPIKRVVKSYCHISTLCCLYEKMIFSDTSSLALEQRVIYGTDLPMTQTDWIKMQVDALNEVGFKAGFLRSPIWVLYGLSFVISFITGVIGADNPLPRSRVHSMTYSYLVSLKAPSFLSYNRNAEELWVEVSADVDRRING